MGNLVPTGMDSATGQPRIAQLADVIQASRMTGSAGTPTYSIGAGAGTGTPTASIAGTDLGGNITVNTGTVLTPTGSGTIIAVSFFNTGYSSAPNCILLTPGNSTTALLSGSGSCFVNQAGITATTFAITAGATAIIGASTYRWYYAVIW